MTWTFGQTEKIIPLVNYYFEILNTQDEITYGTKELNLKMYHLSILMHKSTYLKIYHLKQIGERQ